MKPFFAFFSAAAGIAIAAAIPHALLAKPQTENPAAVAHQTSNKGALNMQNSFDRLNVFKKGSPNTAYAQYFDGNSYLNRLTASPVGIANVTFEPGARNHWHIHKATRGGGQILLCVAGEGWYQEEGKDPVSLTPGSVVQIPANVRHWHGAKSNTWFSHVSIEVPGENTQNVWLEPVKDYDSLPPAQTDAAPKVTAGRDAMGEFAPKFAQLNDDVLFGEVWARDDKLSTRDRSLITVTALMSSGILDSSLEFHIKNARAHGVTAEEMSETITQLAFYVGWPKAWAALRMAKKIYQDG